MKYLKSFEKTISSHTELFQELLKVDKTIEKLFKIIDDIESSQDGLWKHIDYGIRTPAFRHMQWIEYKIGINYRKAGALRIPLDEVNTHLLKEYFQLWFTVLDTFSKIDEDELFSKLKDVVTKNKMIYSEDEIKSVLKELRSGISNELKASYVLTDHKKPFLPFSIMQAPIVPTIMRLGASGDLYLFEEDIVVDVKSGWLVKTHDLGKLPTYYYRGRGANLSQDLRKCRDLGHLFGIRKGIGVVAEDNRNEIIHFAIYVPWRFSRIHGPLIYLSSYKLPFLIYIHRKGHATYVGKVRNNTLTVDLEALVLTRNREVWINGSNWEISIYLIKKYVDRKGRKRARLYREIRSGNIEFKQIDEDFYKIKVGIPVSEENKFEVISNKKNVVKEFYAFELIHKDKHLKIPVVVSTED